MLTCIAAAVAICVNPASFGGTDAENPSTLLVGSSPFDAPERNDLRFVVGTAPDLDTGCTYSSAGPLEFDIAIDRYFGLTDGPSLELQVARGRLPAMVRLQMPAFDVDFDAVVPGVNPERDRVFFNDHLVPGAFLTGDNNVWKLNTFEVPIQWVRFPSVDPGPHGQVQPALNRVRIEIDTENPGNPSWCTAIDWASLSIDFAPRPAILVHGIISSGNTWANWMEWLQGQNIPVTGGGGAASLPGDSLDMGWLGSISGNAVQIGAKVQEAKRRWGVDRVNLICHSKGGLDSRELAENSDDIDRVIQIGTPNGGSPLADLIQRIGLRLCLINPFVCVAKLGVTLIMGPAGIQLTTYYMAGYNTLHPLNADVTYVAMAGVFTPNCSGLDLTCNGCAVLAAIVGVGDTIVPEWSVHALPMDFEPTYHSSPSAEAKHTNQTSSDDIFALLVSHAAAPASAPQSLTSPVFVGPSLTASQLSAAGALASGESATYSMFIDRQPEVAFTLLQGTSSTAFSIESPSGTIVQEGSTSPGVVFGQEEVFDSRIKTFAVTQPEVGMWRLHVRQTGSTTGIAAHGVAAMLSDHQTSASLSVDDDSVAVGDSLIIRASITSQGVSVPGVQVTVFVKRPDESVTQHQLMDNGIAPDTAAGDGIYSAAYIQTDQEGRYQMLAQCDATMTPLPFMREAQALATVVAAQVTLAGTITEQVSDTNGNGLYDLLRFNVPVVSASPGAFRAIGELRDSTGRTHFARESVVLGVGAQNVAIEFRGDAIYDGAVDGPFTLVRIAIAKDVAGELYPTVDEDPMYSTAPYGYVAFEHNPIEFTGNGSALGVDTNGNGLFDRLDTRIEVLLAQPGSYAWSARLVEPGGAEVGFASGGSVLTSGLNLLALDFSGATIGTAAFDGPYSVRDVLVLGGSLSQVETGPVFVTPAFLAAEFEAFQPNTPPAFSQCPGVINASVGVEIIVQICAFDADAHETVALSVSTVPDGASFEPALPQFANPVCTAFRWTPKSNDVGVHVISFTATDEHDIATQCVITVNVAECYLLFGVSEGMTTHEIAGHAFPIQLAGVRRLFPVTMESGPSVPYAMLPNSIYAQVVMFNPQLFPANADQCSQVIRVQRLGHGVIDVTRSGVRDGMTLSAQTYMHNGELRVRFPFLIDGM